MDPVKVSMSSGKFPESLVVYFGEYEFEVAASLPETSGIQLSIVAEVRMAR